MTDAPEDPAAALDRLSRFAKGERMQDVWSGHYVPDLIREDLKRILPAKAEDGSIDPADKDALLDICDRLQDEGDRVYLGSTNDAEALRDLGRRVWFGMLDAAPPTSEGGA